MVTRDAIVAAARAWIGTPYHHQASRCGVGCDCLGLIRGVWRSLYGAEAAAVPPYGRNWGLAGDSLGDAARRHLLPCAAPAPGDVLLFAWRPGRPARHCAVLTTPDHMIHAVERRLVAEVPCDAPWRRRLVACFCFPGVTEP